MVVVNLITSTTFNDNLNKPYLGDIMDKKEEVSNRKTLKELGSLLPIGLIPKPEWKFAPKDNSFKFKEWGFEQEQEIAKLKNKENSSGKFAAEVMNMMLDELGGVKWDSIGEAKRLVLNQLYMGDMLYLYICLRIEALGHEFALNGILCPHCGHKHKEFVADLRDIDVDTLPKDEKPDQLFEYKLKKPIKYSHKGSDGEVPEDITLFKIARSKWQTMEELTMEMAENGALAKKCILKGSIAGYNDSEGYVDADKMIGSLKKIDYEMMDKFIGMHNLGPTIVVADDCKSCGKKWAQQINWSYDHFFGASSLPSV